MLRVLMGGLLILLGVSSTILGAAFVRGPLFYWSDLSKAGALQMQALVVDYKTNRPAPDRIEDADPAYGLQLAIYVAVLRRLYPDRPVEAALVWTDGPRLMRVPQALMDAALKAAR